MNRRSATTTRCAIAATVLLLLVGCTSIKRQPVPIEDIDRAIVPGMRDIRDWGDEPSPHFQEDLIQSVRDAWEASDFDPGHREMHALVLSGGGSNGAFGAGYLDWRPHRALRLSRPGIRRNARGHLHDRHQQGRL